MGDLISQAKVFVKEENNIDEDTMNLLIDHAPCKYDQFATLYKIVSNKDKMHKLVNDANWSSLAQLNSFL